MTALYQKVCGKILDEVESGVLQVGMRLPPEASYAAELGVSRSTLRLAFAELERLGVLQRRKRAGTKIIADRPKPRFTMGTRDIYDLLSLGRDTELVITTTRTVRTRDISCLDGYGSETERWLEVSGTRTLAHESSPFNVNRVYVPDRFAGVEPVLKTSVTSVFHAIETRFDVAVGRVSQAAKAIACPAEDADIIGLLPGDPVMQIVAQLYQRDGRLMEISVGIFNPEKFQVRTDVQIE